MTSVPAPPFTARSTLPLRLPLSAALYTVREVLHQLHDTKARYLFTVPSFLDTAKEAAARVSHLPRRRSRVAFYTQESKP